MAKPSSDILKKDSGHPHPTSPVLQSLFLHFHDKVQKHLQVCLKKSERHDKAPISSIIERSKVPSTVLDVDQEKQLQAWKANPFWNDHSPNIKVTVPKGSLCNLSVDVNVGLPPDAVYDIVTDPENKRVFKNIKEVISRKVVVDEGFRQVVEVEQAAIWKFLWLSGTISVHVLVDQNRENYTMKFKQLRTGFMRRFEGCWKVEPILVDEDLCSPFKPKTLADYVSCTKGKGRIGSKVSLEQLIQPAVVPPPPFSWYLRGITARTTEMIVNDLVAEAARIRGYSHSENSKAALRLSEKKSEEIQVDDITDIKKRWALRRRKNRNVPRRFSRAIRNR